MLKTIYRLFNALKQNRYKALHHLRKFALLWLIFTIFSGLTELIPERVPSAKTYTALISTWENHFKPVKEDLPFETSILGYIDDSYTSQVTAQGGNTEAEYIMTQFVMAPVIVKQGDQYDWVLINMTEKKIKMWLEQKGKSYEVSSYGFNLYLAKRIK